MEGVVRQELSLGLTGFPLAGSLSPGLHMAALRALSLQGEYRLYPVPPLPEGEASLADLVKRVRLGEIDGLNVTIPHKQSVIPYLDGLIGSARAIGAVNTIFREGDQVFGDNTDAPGFIQDLGRLIRADLERAAIPGGKQGRKSALVLGAGGAARAVVYALWQSGWRVAVAARHLEQSRALVGSFHSLQGKRAENVGRIEAIRLDPTALVKFQRQIGPEFRLLVNASSAGMLPNKETSAWPDEVPFAEGTFVYDLVYKPAETALMQSARLAGLKAANGLGMLVEQAALSLERWTGRAVPREIMRQVIDTNHGMADSPPSTSNEENS